MRAPPFRRDRAMASAAASASTSGIGSGSPTYGRDGSETVHRRHRPATTTAAAPVPARWSAGPHPPEAAPVGVQLGRRSAMARSSSNMMATSRAMRT